MDTYNIHEAKTNLSKLIARAESGEEIVIARNGQPAARLIPAGKPMKKKKSRQPGGWEGKVWLAPDWDSKETNEMIADLFYNSKIFPDDASS